MRLLLLEKYAAVTPAQDSPDWDELRASRSPTVRKLVDKRDQEIHKGLMTAGLTSAGLGLGVLGLRNLAVDPTSQQSLSNFLNFDKTRAAAGDSYGSPGRHGVEEGLRAVSEHSALASDAMQSKFFGFDADKVLKTVRNMPWVAEKDRWNQGSQDHYDAFKKGPLSGMLRQVEEQLIDQGVSGPKGPWKDALPFIRDNVNELVKKDTGIKDYFNTATSSGYTDTAYEALDRGKQLDLMKQLGPALEKKYGDSLLRFVPGTDARAYAKHFKPFVTDNLGYLPDASVKKYRDKLLGMPMAIHEAMGPVGWTALLGGAGLTGYGAYRWLKNRRKQKENDKRPTGESGIQGS